MQEVAARYAKLIASFDKKEKLADASHEQIRQVLYGEGVAANVSLAEADSLFGRDDQSKIRELRKKVDGLKATHPGAPAKAMVLNDSASPGNSAIFIRGNAGNPGPQAPRQFLAVLSPAKREPFKHGSGRLDLAQVIASRSNPLTARVMVNRIWLGHFGQGIVRTPSDFGTRGLPPTHPELLDYLAVRFMDEGWSIKKMHRLIMTSEAYRMASAFDDVADKEKDPQNQYLWRFRAQRLDAEVVRDAILESSGGINLAVGGPPVFPPLPKELMTEANHGIWKTQEDGPATWRRSVYVYRKRGLAFPMFQVFDLPEQNVTSAARYVSTVPTQALTMLNDAFVLRHAQLFAARVTKEAGDDPAKRVDLAYRIALTRPPTDAELAVTKTQPLADVTHVLFNVNEFVYTR
jgi:hypothetical protein